MTHDARLVAAAVVSWAAAAWWAGCSSSLVATCAAAAGSGAIVLRRPAIAVVLLCLAATGVSVSLRLAAVESSPVVALAQHHAAVRALVHLRAPARSFGTGVVAEVAVDRLVVDGGVVVGGGSATAFLPGDAPVAELVAGSHAALTARLGPAERPQDVATLDVQRVEVRPGTAWWWRAASAVRGGVRRAAGHGPAAGRALVPGLVVGDDAQLSAATRSDFRRAGLTHLLAVSGTNLTIVLVGVLTGAVALGVRRRFRWLIGALAIAGFVLVACPEPSVLRAAVMGAVGLVALGIGRRGGIRALAVAILVLVVADPWLARSAGFVLSVCATAGIVLLAEPVARRLGWLPRWLALAVAVPAAAEFAVTPALVALSGQVSFAALIANLAAAPAVAPATILGLAGGLLDLIWSPLGAILGWQAAAAAGWIAWVGRWAGGLEGASVDWPGPWWLAAVVLPPLGWAAWKLARRPVVVLGLSAGLLVAMVRVPSPGWPPAGWVMVACDVGQGDATVLALDRPGEAVVVDTGPDDAHVHACLQRLRIHRIRLFVITHGDADHAAGWAGVARGRRVDQVLLGVGGGQPPPGVPVHQAAAGEAFGLGSVSGEVLWPVAGGRFESTNAACIVLRVLTHGVRILLTCDIAPESQTTMLRAGADLRADILKFPHHGSRYQDPRFIAATGARIATISVGAGNDYGHPTREALAMLAADGIAWLRTDQHGDIAIAVVGGRLRVATQR